MMLKFLNVKFAELEMTEIISKFNKLMVYIRLEYQNCSKSGKVQ